MSYVVHTLNYVARTRKASVGDDVFEVVGRWIDWMEVRELSEETVRNYADALLRAGRIARKDPRRFDADDVVSVLRTYGKHGGAKVMMLRALRSFASFACSRKLMKADPTRDLRLRNARPGQTPALSPDEVRDLLRAAFRKSPWRGVVGQFEPAGRCPDLPSGRTLGTMPERSRKRPRDLNEMARQIVDEATDEDRAPDEATGEPTKDPAAVELGRRGGLKGGKARASKLSAERRREIARRAAQARWARSRPE